MDKEPLDTFKSGNKVKIASFVITFLLILAYELVILYSCFYDWVHLQRSQNLYQSTVYIKDHNFMPSIQLALLSNSDAGVKEMKDLKIMDENGQFDIAEVEQYVQFQVRMTQIENGAKTEKKRAMRPCSLEDYEERRVNVTLDKMLKMQLEQQSRICPDIEDEQVQNAQSNTENQSSFSIEIIRCTGANAKCKPDDEITKLLSKLLFKSYYVADYVNYLPAIQNTSALPMTAKDHFH